MPPRSPAGTRSSPPPSGGEPCALPSSSAATPTAIAPPASAPGTFNASAVAPRAKVRARVGMGRSGLGWRGGGLPAGQGPAGRRGPVRAGVGPKARAGNRPRPTRMDESRSGPGQDRHRPTVRRPTWSAGRKQKSPRDAGRTRADDPGRHLGTTESGSAAYAHNIADAASQSYRYAPLCPVGPGY